MGCATTGVKYLVFFFNLLFVIGSLALIGVGIFLKVVVDRLISADRIHSENEYDQDVVQLFKWAPVAIIVVGVIVFIISFLGCCGAIRENTCMLTTFAVILLIFFAIQAALGIYLLVEVKRDGGSIDNFLTDLLNRKLEQYKTVPFMEKLQEELRCCGVHGAGDWERAGIPVRAELPKTCCDNKNYICNIEVGNYYTDGCVNKLMADGGFYLTLVGAGLLALALFELIGAVAVCCLTNSIRNAERRGVYA